MVVYVVFEKDWQGDIFHGVFATLEGAKAYNKRLHGTLNIEEVEVQP